MDYLKAKRYDVMWLNSFKEELSHIYHYISVNLNNHVSVKKLHKKILNSLFFYHIIPKYIKK